jgi:hypothetical protein
MPHVQGEEMSYSEDESEALNYRDQEFIDCCHNCVHRDTDEYSCTFFDPESEGACYIFGICDAYEPTQAHLSRNKYLRTYLNRFKVVKK